MQDWGSKAEAGACAEEERVVNAGAAQAGGREAARAGQREKGSQAGADAGLHRTTCALSIVAC